MPHLNKIRFTLTASLVLAITFTLSCEDKETKDKPAPAAAVTAETVSAVSESGSKIMYVNDAKGLNMRSEPSTDGVKLGTLFYGAKVQILEKSSTPVKIGEITDYWYKIDTNVTIGGKSYKHSWVFGGYLSETPSAAAPAPKKVTFTDPRDGKKYKSVKIGKQVWMAENLNYKTKGGKCFGEGGKFTQRYYEGETEEKTLSKAEVQANCTNHGRLYNWETAMKACPSGWHLPSKEEWETLLEFAGGIRVAGKKLLNEMGFTGSTPGYGWDGRFFSDPVDTDSWWSTTEDNDEDAYIFNIGYTYLEEDGSIADHDGGSIDVNGSSGISPSPQNKNSMMYSVRCIQD